MIAEKPKNRKPKKKVPKKEVPKDNEIVAAASGSGFLSQMQDI